MHSNRKKSRKLQAFKNSRVFDKVVALMTVHFSEAIDTLNKAKIPLKKGPDEKGPLFKEIYLKRILDIINKNYENQVETLSFETVQQVDSHLQSILVGYYNAYRKLRLGLGVHLSIEAQNAGPQIDNWHTRQTVLNVRKGVAQFLQLVQQDLNQTGKMNACFNIKDDPSPLNDLFKQKTKPTNAQFGAALLQYISDFYRAYIRIQKPAEMSESDFSSAHLNCLKLLSETNQFILTSIDDLIYAAHFETLTQHLAVCQKDIDAAIDECHRNLRAIKQRKNQLVIRQIQQIQQSASINESLFDLDEEIDMPLEQPEVEEIQNTYSLSKAQLAEDNVNRMLFWCDVALGFYSPLDEEGRQIIQDQARIEELTGRYRAERNNYLKHFLSASEDSFTLKDMNYIKALGTAIELDAYSHFLETESLYHAEPKTYRKALQLSAKKCLVEYVEKYVTPAHIRYESARNFSERAFFLSHTPKAVPVVQPIVNTPPIIDKGKERITSEEEEEGYTLVSYNKKNKKKKTSEEGPLSTLRAHSSQQRLLNTGWEALRQRDYATVNETLERFPLRDRDNQWRILKAAYLGRVNHYSSAIELSEQLLKSKLSGSEKNTVYLNLAFVYFGSKQYKQAIQAAKKVLDWQQRLEPTMLIARSYFKQGEFDNAAATVEGLPSDVNFSKFKFFCVQLYTHHEDKSKLEKLLTTLNANETKMARGYELLIAEKLDEAIEIFQSIPDWQMNYRIAMEMTNIYFKQGKHREIIPLLFPLLNSKDNFSYRVHFSLARAYTDCERYDASIDLLLSIPDWSTHIIALRELIYCYGKLQNSEKVFEYAEILMQKDTFSGCLHLGKYYDEIGDYKEALSLFTKAKALSPIAIIRISIAKCLQKMGEHKQAIAEIKSIENWRSLPLALNQIAYAHIALGHYDLAIKQLEEYEHLNHTPVCLDVLALALKERGKPADLDRALTIYQLLIDRNQLHVKWHEHYIQLLLKMDIPETRATIDTALSLWPNRAMLYVYAAKFYGRFRIVQDELTGANHNGIQIALNVLLKASSCFPYAKGIYEELIRIYSALKMASELKAVLDKCTSLFDDDENWLHRLDHIQREKASVVLDNCPEAILLSENNVPQTICAALDKIDQLAEHQLEEVSSSAVNLARAYRLPKHGSLPGILHTALNLLPEGIGRRHLVGGAVINMYRGELDKMRDIDLVIESNSATFAYDNHFKPSINRENLFTSGFYYQGKWLPVDVSLTNNITEDDVRDFTICAVRFSVDENLYIDPYGGLVDIEDKRLCTIDDATTTFREDPVRLLRAVKYILDGYTPDEACEEGLMNFEKPFNLKMDHLWAVIRRHFNTVDSLSYVKVLNKYGLLSKLFNIQPVCDSDQSLQEVAIQLSRMAKNAKNPQRGRHFNQPLPLATQALLPVNRPDCSI